MSNNRSFLYNLIKTEDGTYTLFNETYKDIYHTKKGALKEALYKFLLPLKELFKIQVKKINKSKIIIFDLGFGLGYNRFIFEYYLKKLNLDYNLISIEKDKDLLNFIIDKKYLFKKIKDYSKFLDRVSKIIIEDNKKIKELSHLENNPLYLVDAIDFFRKLRTSIRYKSIKNSFLKILLHDGFTPSKNKELWDINFFSLMSDLHIDIIISYSSNPKVINALLLNDYTIFKTKAFGRKKGGILALNNKTFKKEELLRHFIKINLNKSYIKKLSLIDYIFLISTYGKPFNFQEKWGFWSKRKAIKLINKLKENKDSKNLKNEILSKIKKVYN